MTRTEFLGLAKREPKDRYNLAENNENLNRIDLFAQTTAPPIVETVNGELITITDSAEAPLQGLTIYGKSKQNGTPTEEAPINIVSVGESGNISVNVCGKNMFKTTATSKTNNGVIYTVNDDGSIYVDSKNKTSRSTLSLGNITLPAGEYRISSGSYYMIGNNACNFVLYNMGSPAAQYITTNDATITVTDTVTKAIALEVTTNFRSTGTVFPMIIPVSFPSERLGTGPYFEKFYPYDGQTVSLSTPNGLKGIAVARNGNYTDSNGQNWLCDEIDFAKGIKVQRIGVIESYNGESVGSNYISTTGALTTGAKVIYSLSTPIETPLLAEEIEAYKKARTKKPYTAVVGDGANIEASYIADTKLYIDNKFTALNNAILNNI